jgi:thiosulfate dehydrogenase
MNRITNKSLLFIFVCLAMALMITSFVSGRPFRLKKLPDEGSNFGCLTCHKDPQNYKIRNPFGQDWEKIALKSDDKYTEELGKLDSDGDGFTNAEEFASKTNPGDPVSKPDKKADSNVMSVNVDPNEELAKVIAKGKELFNDPKLGKSEMSCNSCHPAGGTTGGQMMGMAIPKVKGAAATFPKYKPMAKGVITLQQMNNMCIQMMKGQPLELDSPESIALATYVTSLSNGTPINVGNKKINADSKKLKK